METIAIPDLDAMSRAQHREECDISKRFCMCGRPDSDRMTMEEVHKVYNSLAHMKPENRKRGLLRLTPSARSQVRNSVGACVHCLEHAYGNECDNCMTLVCSFCSIHGFCSNNCLDSMRSFSTYTDAPDWSFLSEFTFPVGYCVVCKNNTRSRARGHICQECGKLPMNANRIFETILLDPEFYSKERHNLRDTMEAMQSDLADFSRDKNFDEEARMHCERLQEAMESLIELAIAMHRGLI